MDIRAYRIWLSHALSYGSTKVRRVLKHFGTIENFYEQGYKAWSSMGIFTERELQAMKEFSVEHAQFQMEYCEKLGQKIYTPESKEYPECLRNISNPPGVLYVKGTMPDFDNCLAISIIGSRKANESAKKTAYYLGYDLAKKDVIVVSGGAIGGDIEAHKGALKAVGITVCVLPCGINYPYLTQNAKIREEIAENGALISEYPPDTGVDRGNFEIRNRIMSGLARGVAVTHAGLKSGTMITVRHALNQGRDVFAVPGDINNPEAAGTNKLIQDGAKMILCADDILLEYSGIKFKSPKEKQEVLVKEVQNPQPDIQLSGDQALLYEFLTETPAHISQIERALSMPTKRILAAATELELIGLIVSYSGRRFSKANTKF